MIIKTKYDPETTAWVMHKNKPLNCFIERVETATPHSGEKGILIIYYMRHVPHYFYEDDVYETKEALLQSL